MDAIPFDCLTTKTCPAELLERWADERTMCDMVERLAAGMREGDELWFYDYGPYTGLAVVRSGTVIENETYMHAYIAPPELRVFWAGERPTNAEMLAIRQLDPHLRERPIHEVRALLSSKAGWQLGPFPSSDVDAVELQCRAFGLRTERA